MSIDWAALFRLDSSALELIVRVSVVYWAVILAFRVLGRRQMGAMGLIDVLLVVLIADGVQNGLAGDYKSISGALVVVSTLVAWSLALDILSFRFSFVRRLLQPGQLKVVENGRMLRQQMRREFITRDELESQLRAQGIEDIAEVKSACLEPDGELSVVKWKPDEDGARGPRRKSPVS